MNRCQSNATLAVAATLILPTIALAQDIHKCVDGDHVTYQSAACPHDDKVVHVWQTAPTAADAAAAAARLQAAQRVSSGVAPGASALPQASSAPASAPPGGHRHR